MSGLSIEYTWTLAGITHSRASLPDRRVAVRLRLLRVFTWYYGEWQTAYENLDIPNMRLEEGLPTSFDTDDGKRGLVVLDDLMPKPTVA